MNNATYCHQTSSTWLKFGTLLEVNEQQNEIHKTGSPDLSIGNAGDGAAFNVKTSQTDSLWIQYAWQQCATHIVSGVAKRLATLKTISGGSNWSS